MSATVEFVGGPLDGQVRQVVEALWELRFPRSLATRRFLTRDDAMRQPLPDPPLVYRRRPGVYGRRLDGVLLYDWEPRGD